MDKPIVIIHFQPLELYPPVMNLLDYLARFHTDVSVYVLTTQHAGRGTRKFTAGGKKIKILRLGKSGSALPLPVRYISYFYFYITSFLMLAIRRPSAVLYYETLSSYPVYLYKKYCAAKLAIFIHYHEYTSPREYLTGMKLVANFHKKEKKLYKEAAWISHTNEDRLSLFLADENFASGPNTHVLPNYPSILWQRKPCIPTGPPVKIVYAGALSMDTMYTEAFANWVLLQNGKFLWDIYSNNTTEDARIYFDKLNSPHIRLLNGVDYAALKDVLPQYNIGIVIYKGHILNYVFNAPNKLFEYLACGLDVWYPDIMKGCKPYTTAGTYPVVMPVNFLAPDNLFIDIQLNKSGYIYKPSGYFYENVYPKLVKQIIAANQ